MSTQDQVEEAINELDEEIAEVANDTRRWTQAQSAEIYESLAESCRERGALIRREMGE